MKVCNSLICVAKENFYADLFVFLKYYVIIILIYIIEIRKADLYNLFGIIQGGPNDLYFLLGIYRGKEDNKRV